jgi:hypothetical protein
MKTVLLELLSGPMPFNMGRCYLSGFGPDE